jgi:prolyl 4-hydroxylase
LSGGAYSGVVKEEAPAVDAESVKEAVRLLGGTVKDVMDGISLIEAAAARGEAAALERKALFEAVGCARPPNWNRALDCLRDAAEGGCQIAQEQLRILARVPGSESRKPLNWTAVRSQVSIEKLAEIPKPRAISESPRLRRFEEFASAAECAWLMERARHRLRPALVVNPTGSQTAEPVRTNSGIDFQLRDMDLVVEAIRVRISAATRLPLPLFEPSQVLHYSPGQEFRPHHDYFDPQLPGHVEELRTVGQRIATFLIYLNDRYTGGETTFPRAKLSFRGNTGDALFIANVERSGRPDPMTLHSGAPPISGEKWIFSQWIRDKRPEQS